MDDRAQERRSAEGETSKHQMRGKPKADVRERACDILGKVRASHRQDRLSSGCNGGSSEAGKRVLARVRDER